MARDKLHSIVAWSRDAACPEAVLIQLLLCGMCYVYTYFLTAWRVNLIFERFLVSQIPNSDILMSFSRYILVRRLCQSNSSGVFDRKHFPMSSYLCVIDHNYQKCVIIALSTGNLACLSCLCLDKEIKSVLQYLIPLLSSYPQKRHIFRVMDSRHYTIYLVILALTWDSTDSWTVTKYGNVTKYLQEIDVWPIWRYMMCLLDNV